MAAPAPWRQRLDGLGITPEEKGRAITLIMRMPEADRETQVDVDVEVAKASVRELLSAVRPFDASIPFDIIRQRLPAASRHAAHIRVDPNDASRGCVAATVVAPDKLVTFAHKPHTDWDVGTKVKAMVHDGTSSHRRPVDCEVLGKDLRLDVAVLQVDRQQCALVPPDMDFQLYPGQEYFLLGQSTQAQPDDSSVSHGKIAATEPDELCHVRGDVESGRGDSGGGVFSLLSGKLVAVCIGNDPVGNKAVMVPMASVMYFVGMLPAHK